MPTDEIDIKIEICDHLGLTPVFAVRWIKPYTEEIRRRGGFSWVFKTQIYPREYERLTKEICDRLQLPVIVRTEPPEKTIEIFVQWVVNKKS
ncbi:MAG: hypothetical protein QXX95_06580 [Nitrososphaerales archaeon]